MSWLLLVLLGTAPAATPSGHVDVADGTHIAGWASDGDITGPIAVHIYVDGEIVQGLLADQYRSDVGDHAFDWVHEPFGAGEHTVAVYAIGVDAAGALDGENPLLGGSPTSFDVGCAGLSGDPRAWCDGNPAYWEDRQSDTEYLVGTHVRAGVSPTYGGTILQLFDGDWTENLLMEHGGAAIQLSIWGYDPVGGTGYFGQSWCDPTPYASDADCRGAGHSSCVARAYGEGDHVADCTSVDPCVGWSAGAPYNPIQAQGSSCGWDNGGNDATPTWSGAALTSTLSSPRHFTKSGAGVSGLTFARTVTPEDAWIRIDDHITYSGVQTWVEHDQEVPAIFTAQGVDAHFYWYEGDAPYTDPTSPVASTSAPLTAVLALPGTDPRTGFAVAGTTSERWWTACDSDQDRCLTVASWERDLIHASLQAQPGSGAYLTAMSRFPMTPGLDQTWTTVIFPHRYDADVGGRTVRQILFELAAAEGCTAEVACNGVDEDCTGADLCDETATDTDTPPDTGSTGGTPADTGAPTASDDTATPTQDTSDGRPPDPEDLAPTDPSGCGCTSASPAPSWLALGLALLGLARRRTVG